MSNTFKIGKGAPQFSSIQKALAELAKFEPEEVSGVDVSDQAMPKNTDVPGGPKEPVFDSREQDDIQGNIIPGFNKGHQRFIFFAFEKKKNARQFLKRIFPYLSSMKEVLSFRKLYRERRLKLGKNKTFLSSTHVNLGFSNSGIEKLVSRSELEKFGDLAFKTGMTDRSTFLGDPDKKSSPGHVSKWKFGGAENSTDLIVIVASDCEHHAEELSALIRSHAETFGLTFRFEQIGETLPGHLRGHEHFGFRDGISQPGIRGKLSRSPGDYITPRYFEETDSRRLYMAKPGQLLVWPGQFLLGEKRQSSENLTQAFRPQDDFPEWAKQGSYLVVRRLRQDVAAFWDFVSKVAAQLKLKPTDFASKLVGRWPSGAPLMRAPKKDNPALAADEFANNHFLYDDDTLPSNLKPIPGYPGDRFPDAKADFLATVCPHFAHIRKVNPRESVTDMGKPEDNPIRAILRRGIPFGSPVVGKTKISKQDWAEERGLMFLCYNSSIVDQFEFLQRRWSNATTAPNLGGHDPIIGQNGSTGVRERFIEFPQAGKPPLRISFPSDFVIPTGGEYYFAPTLAAIRDVLSQ